MDDLAIDAHGPEPAVLCHSPNPALRYHQVTSLKEGVEVVGTTRLAIRRLLGDDSHSSFFILIDVTAVFVLPHAVGIHPDRIDDAQVEEAVASATGLEPA